MFKVFRQDIDREAALYVISIAELTEFFCFEIAHIADSGKPLRYCFAGLTPRLFFVMGIVEKCNQGAVRSCSAVAG